MDANELAKVAEFFAQHRHRIEKLLEQDALVRPFEAINAKGLPLTQDMIDKAMGKFGPYKPSPAKPSPVNQQSVAKPRVVVDEAEELKLTQEWMNQFWNHQYNFPVALLHELRTVLARQGPDAPTAKDLTNCIYLYMLRISVDWINEKDDE